MSDVLKKKIATASGIPPSLMRNKAFWATQTDLVSAWILATLDEVSHPKLTGRQVAPGKLIESFEPDGLQFTFQADHHTGISAIIYDRAFVSFYTARRLSSPIEEASNVSELFTKLVMEECTLRLFQALQSMLSLSDEIVDPRAALSQGELDPQQRYLTVSLKFEITGEAFNLYLILNNDVIRKLQRGGRLKLRPGEFSSRPKILQDTVQASEIRVTAVLDRLLMRVGECARFEIGQVVTLEGAELNNLKLMAGTLSGKSEIARGEMGVWKTNRALKLQTPVSSEFARDLVGQ